MALNPLRLSVVSTGGIDRYIGPICENVFMEWLPDFCGVFPPELSRVPDRLGDP